MAPLPRRAAWRYAGALSAEGEREREPVSKLMDRLMHLVRAGVGPVAPQVQVLRTVFECVFKI